MQITILFPPRSINVDAEVVGLQCDIHHPPGLERLNLVLSWFHNQDPTPFLIWRLRDPFPETFGRLIQLQDVHLRVEKRSSERTDTHLFLLNTNLMMSGIMLNIYVSIQRLYTLKVRTLAWSITGNFLSKMMPKVETWLCTNLPKCQVYNRLKSKYPTSSMVTICRGDIMLIITILGASSTSPAPSPACLLFLISASSSALSRSGLTQDTSVIRTFLKFTWG